MALTSLLSLANSALNLSNLILVTPATTVGYQPQDLITNNGSTPPSRPSLLFHYEAEQSVTLQSDITDHFVEDNTAIQDQIALKPEKITTSGFIGELNDIAPPALRALQLAAQKLTTISAYTPGLSVAALNAYNQAAFLYSNVSTIANAAVSAWSSVTGSSSAGGESVIGQSGLSVQPSQNKQQVAFQQFYGYWKSRTLFTVQTPWAVFQNMAIESLRAIQEGETEVISNFEITFKIIRYASTSVAFTGVSRTDFEGRLQLQASNLLNLGTSTPPLSPLSLNSAIGTVTT